MIWLKKCETIVEYRKTNGTLIVVCYEESKLQTGGNHEHGRSRWVGLGEHLPAAYTITQLHIPGGKIT